MANGFPKPRGEPAFPTLGGFGLPKAAQSTSLPLASNAGAAREGMRPRLSSSVPANLPRPARSSPLRSCPLFCGLALLVLAGAGAGLASHSFGTQSAQSAIAPVAIAVPRATVVLQRTLPSVAQQMGTTRAPPAPIVNAAPNTKPEANVFHGVGPGVPEAYTGDPAGQALWDKTVEEDQQTLQPDDLIEEPPVPPLDLSKNPAYQSLHIDADGNTNEP